MGSEMCIRDRYLRNAGGDAGFLLAPRANRVINANATGERVEGVFLLCWRGARSRSALVRLNRRMLCHQCLQPLRTELGAVFFSLDFHRHRQVPEEVIQDLDGDFLLVASKANDRRHPERPFAERLDESAGGVELLLASDSAPAGEIPDDAFQREDMLGSTIDLRRRGIPASIAEVPRGKARPVERIHAHHRAATTGAVETHQPLAFGGKLQKETWLMP